MKLSMKDFRALMENDLTRGPEPKLVGPAPAAPSKDDKLNANDSVMDLHTRVGSKTTSKVEESSELSDDSLRAELRATHPTKTSTKVDDPKPIVGSIGCTHDSATEKLPVDKTGYPTTPGPALVDRAGIGAVIAAESVLNEKYTKAPVFITPDLNGIVESVLNLTDDKIIPITESFSYRYREQLLDRSKYPDIPILEAMDTIFALAENECTDPEMKEKIAECEDATIKKMNQVTTECGFCPNQRNLNELTPMDPGMRVNTYPMYPPEAGVRSTAKFLGNLEAAQTFEEITECMISLTRMTMESSAYYKVTTEGTLVVTEGIGAAAREASRKVANGTRGVLRKGKNAADSVKATVKHATDPMVKFMEETRDKIKKADSAERREIILRGGSIQKVLRWLKRAIPISVGLAVGQVIPIAAVISAIAFIGWIATDKALDQRERQKILKELEDEIEMVNEKIDDARGDSNKQKKYELMRIRNKLNRTHDNIKFNLGSKTLGRDDEAEETMKSIAAKKENKK